MYRYWCQYPFPDLDTDLYHEMQKTASLECLSVFDRACLTWEKLCCIFHTKCLPGYFGATVWPCLSIPTSRNGGCDWLRRNRSGTVLPCLPAIRIKALLEEFRKTFQKPKTKLNFSLHITNAKLNHLGFWPCNYAGTIKRNPMLPYYLLASSGATRLPRSRSLWDSGTFSNLLSARGGGTVPFP